MPAFGSAIRPKPGSSRPPTATSPCRACRSRQPSTTGSSWTPHQHFCRTCPSSRRSIGTWQMGLCIRAHRQARLGAKGWQFRSHQLPLGPARGSRPRRVDPEREVLGGHAGPSGAGGRHLQRQYGLVCGPRRIRTRILWAGAVAVRPDERGEPSNSATCSGSSIAATRHRPCAPSCRCTPSGFTTPTRFAVSTCFAFAPATSTNSSPASVARGGHAAWPAGGRERRRAQARTARGSELSCHDRADVGNCGFRQQNSQDVALEASRFSMFLMAVKRCRGRLRSCEKWRGG